MAEVNNLIVQVLERCKSHLPAPCQAACPLHIDVRNYVRLVKENRFKEALLVVRSTLPFPGIIGRICPHPCEQACRRKDVDTPIRICALKRFIAGYPVEYNMTLGAGEGEEIAVVGGGPAGLMAAHDLRRLGYKVTIFEAEPFLGGMLLSVIPEYRLPREIVRKELEVISSLGITVCLNTRVGTDIGLEELRSRFSAVFLSPGQQMSKTMGLPGEALEGVHYGLQYLKRVKRGEEVDPGKRVVVIGGGNVAIDAARTAWRSGAEKVTILYRRSRSEIRAAAEEIEEAEQEGVDIRYFALPEKIVGKSGRVAGVEYLKTELGPPDDEGRKSPVPIPGSTVLIEADCVIIAIGQAIDRSFLSAVPGLLAGSDGKLVVNPLTMATEVEGFFAGGDVEGKEATAIAALAAGRRAALSIHSYLSGDGAASCAEEEEGSPVCFLKPVEGVARQERAAPPRLAKSEREGNFEEVVHAFEEAEAIQEASRCLDCRCGACMAECEFLAKHTIFPRQLAQLVQGQGADQPRQSDIAYSCNICGLCSAICPEGIDTGKLCLGIREQLVSQGKGPLPGHEAVNVTQQFVQSEAFRFIHPDPRTGACRGLFFPGCNLSGYAPSLVVNTYAYLLERMSDVGILLGCCGGPRHLLGEKEAFLHVLDDLERDMERLGAEEIIFACPDCAKAIGSERPGIRLRSVYEVMAELGLPERAKDQGRTFSLHDSCTARNQKALRESVRILIRRMGYEIHESPYNGELARCCGMGGMVPFADFDLAARVTKRRLDEFPYDVVTYCAACREAFAMEKPAIHVLDLIFNPQWPETLHQPPKTGKKRRQGQSDTRTMVVKLIDRIKGYCQKTHEKPLWNHR